jgi:hypothetical protein
MLKRKDTVTADLEQVNIFLKDRMSAVEGGFLSIFCAKRGKDHCFDFFQSKELGAATEYSVNLADAGYDVYFNQSFLKHKPWKGRGSAADAMATLGVWFDLDVAGPNHKQEALPTKEQAQSFIKDEIPFGASQTVWSGGGYQLHWLFSEPFLIKADKDLEYFKSISRKFQKTIIAKGKDHGWKFDNTSDPARLLRIPGTINYKNEPVLVEVVR